MSVKKIKRSEDVTNAKALEILRALAQSTELSDVQKKTIDYLEKVVEAPADAAEAKVNELVSKFGFARVTAIQLVNLSPQTLDELKYLLSLLERREFSEDELKEMFKILK
ncbi:MAG: RNA polymerase Rpb4 family protein [Thermoproteus sp. AZ2]|uniref:RNA polymerase Rpb4 family protein n=1 Tax=Thermoproteus sp. AZ2 TaxID=1609232 RepID=A0ACC6V0I2_9CREN|nr:MAG: DNA-directed RNA polymerase subunit F [Thermoproteus sp. AZ2]